MKLKLQFWRTDKAVAVTVLECEGIPITKDREGAIEVCSYHITKLFDDGEMILNNHETGMIDVIDVDNPREYIDKLVKNIAKEIFNLKNQKVEVGDIVTVDDDNVEYTVISILPEKYYNRYIVTTSNCKGFIRRPSSDKQKVYAIPNVIPIKKALAMKDVTGNVETYTWEI